MTVLRRPLSPLLAALPGAALAALRATGTERGFPVVPGLAFTTPYAAVGSLLPLAHAVRSRSRTATVLAAASTAVLAAAAADRFRRRPSSEVGDGRPLRLVSLNMLHGKADPAAIRDLVARVDADVLALMEIMLPTEAALAAAGIPDLLPHTHVVPALTHQPSGAGGALYSRWELSDRTTVPGRFGQPSARVVVPGAADVVVTAVHTHPPSFSPSQVAHWERDLQALPDPVGPDGVLQLLAGDFNATVDHGSFRRLLRRGWTDAAQATGQAWRSTWWPVHAPQPRLHLDHVLVPPGVGVRSLEIVHVPGSDHRALVADLLLPRP